MMDQNQEEIPAPMITTAVIIWNMTLLEPFAQNDECAVDQRGKEPFNTSVFRRLKKHERYTARHHSREKPNCPGRIKSIVFIFP